MKRHHLVVAAGLSLILTGCGAPEEIPAPDGAGALALVGGQLIDATGAAPIADSVIVVRDGRIESAGPRDTTPVPEGAETLDLTGKTIIPGLVNLHVHYREGPEEIDRQFRSQLHYGVTTARSTGSDSPERVAYLLESADRARRPPHLYGGDGILVPRRVQRRRPECPDDRSSGAGTRAHTRPRSACTSSRCGSTRSPSRA